MFKELITAMNFIILPDVTIGEYGYHIASDIREYTKQPLVITSNCRTPEVNKSMGGVEDSMHLKCKALDIRSRGLSRKTINQIKQLTRTGLYDIIVEDSPPHIHIELKEDAITLNEQWNYLIQD